MPAPFGQKLLHWLPLLPPSFFEQPVNTAKHACEYVLQPVVPASAYNVKIYASETPKYTPFYSVSVRFLKSYVSEHILATHVSSHMGCLQHTSLHTWAEPTRHIRFSESTATTYIARRPGCRGRDTRRRRRGPPRPEGTRRSPR